MTRQTKQSMHFPIGFVTEFAGYPTCCNKMQSCTYSIHVYLSSSFHIPRWMNTAYSKKLEFCYELINVKWQKVHNQCKSACAMLCALSVEIDSVPSNSDNEGLAKACSVRSCYYHRYIALWLHQLLAMHIALSATTKTKEMMIQSCRECMHTTYSREKLIPLFCDFSICIGFLHLVCTSDHEYESWALH